MGKRIMIQSVKLVKESNKIYDIERKRITSPDDLNILARVVLCADEIPHEVFGVFNLNTKNEVIGCSIVSQGALNCAIIHPRETFRTAILNNAASIACFHNHVSGDPYPSPEDREVTKRLAECGKILGIELLDHVIIGEHRFVSLREKGCIK
ncbi:MULTISPECIES: JAB domain-containing protein [Bacillus]|uniref:DNA repair protein n=1 Tax=Bacillus cereus TaxID=1396 RepID=A0A9X6U567_BACCE|nr:JAB domain-containing protein [Bacillus cereus]PEN75070.1 DNA repair protein [Bacillus cereus]TKH29898.1 DNA repair protein [Bacillus cereus]HEF1903614.1 DNA repair protein [Bacillus cereus]